MITAKEAKELADKPNELVVKRVDEKIREAAETGYTEVDIGCDPEDARRIIRLLQSQGFTAIYNEYTLMLKVNWDD